MNTKANNDTMIAALNTAGIESLSFYDKIQINSCQQLLLNMERESAKSSNSISNTNRQW